MMEKNEAKEYIKKHFTVREEDPEIIFNEGNYGGTGASRTSHLTGLFFLL